MKIIIAGGSGYLGKVLARFYQSIASEIVILSRQTEKPVDNIRFVYWDAVHIGDWMNELESADMLVNLTGKNVNCRYNEKNKNEIISSRVDSTKVLGDALRLLKTPPRLWIQSSSATIYRHSQDKLMTEKEGEIGDGFSVDVCRQWEAAFNRIALPTTRKVMLRTGIVLGKKDGAMPRLVNLAKMGVAKLGHGRQFVSWLHERDFAKAIEWIRTHPHIEGIFNCTSPQPIANSDFMNALRLQMQVPLRFAVPQWALAMGAFMIGTETELILKSRKVYPQRLLDNGFVFEFPDLKSALGDLCQREKRS
jgi:uncharacterized protein